MRKFAIGLMALVLASVIASHAANLGRRAVFHQSAAPHRDEPWRAVSRSFDCVRQPTAIKFPSFQ
jgi:hypothetical protein